MVDSSVALQVARRAQRFLPKPIFERFSTAYTSVSNRMEFRRRQKKTPSVPPLDSDVLFIVVDCLRADHTSMESYDRDTTPFLSEFATNYAEAVSAAPWTFPSVPSLLTGQYPHEHGATFGSDFRNFDTGNLPGTLDEGTFTLGELFAGRGYDTYFSSAIVTASLPVNGRFERIHVDHNAPAERLVDDFKSWWANANDRFGYLHLGDLHQPLEIPEKQPFGDVDEDLAEVTKWDYREDADTDENFEYYRSQRMLLYDTLLAKVDRQIEHLVDFLRHRGELEDTVVVVVGDHGEELWEHATREAEAYRDPRGFYGVGHGHALFEPVVRVPLVLRTPSGTASLPTRPSTVTIASRVLREAATGPVDDIIHHVRTDYHPNSDVVLAEGIGYGYEKKAVYDGDHKYVHSAGEDEPDFLFDLSSDPVEATPIDDVEAHREMARLLPDSAREDIDELSVNGTTRDRLEDLGYI